MLQLCLPSIDKLKTYRDSNETIVGIVTNRFKVRQIVGMSTRSSRKTEVNTAPVKSPEPSDADSSGVASPAKRKRGKKEKKQKIEISLWICGVKYEHGVCK